MAVLCVILLCKKNFITMPPVAVLNFVPSFARLNHNVYSHLERHVIYIHVAAFCGRGPFKGLDGSVLLQLWLRGRLPGEVPSCVHFWEVGEVPSCDHFWEFDEVPSWDHFWEFDEKPSGDHFREVDEKLSLLNSLAANAMFWKFSISSS